jgi:hypothetical protein
MLGENTSFVNWRRSQTNDEALLSNKSDVNEKEI